MFETLRHPFRATNDICWDIARMDAKRHNPLISIFSADKFGEAKYCQFTWLVGAQAWSDDMSTNATDIDDLRSLP